MHQCTLSLLVTAVTPLQLLMLSAGKRQLAIVVRSSKYIRRYNVRRYLSKDLCKFVNMSSHSEYVTPPRTRTAIDTCAGVEEAHSREKTVSNNAELRCSLIQML
jgi:hypothetical protein